MLRTVPTALALCFACSQALVAEVRASDEPSGISVWREGPGRRAPTAGPEAEPHRVATRLPILEYHYSTFQLHDQVMMTPEWFEAQMRWLSENEFTTLSANQLAAYVAGSYLPPERSVVLTFDVGYSKFDDYSEVIVPALRRYRLHAIFFVLASKVEDTCEAEFTCWERLADWQSEGLISIGSHSLTHIDYATLTPAQIAFDAGRSKAILEEKLGQPVLGICYPFDSVNPAAFAILESLGYRFAVGGFTRAERSALSGDPQPYNLPRYYPYSGPAFYPVLSGSGGLTFDELLLGAIEAQLVTPAPSAAPRQAAQARQTVWIN